MVLSGSGKLLLDIWGPSQVSDLLTDLDLSNWGDSAIDLENVCHDLLGGVTCSDVLVGSGHTNCCYESGSLWKSLLALDLSSDGIPHKDEWLLTVLSGGDELSIVTEAEGCDIIGVSVT